jgi:hypothetical protein
MVPTETVVFSQTLFAPEIVQVPPSVFATLPLGRLMLPLMLPLPLPRTKRMPVKPALPDPLAMLVSG